MSKSSKIVTFNTPLTLIDIFQEGRLELGRLLLGEELKSDGEKTKSFVSTINDEGKMADISNISLNYYNVVTNGFLRDLVGVIFDIMTVMTFKPDTKLDDVLIKSYLTKLDFNWLCTAESEEQYDIVLVEPLCELVQLDLLTSFTNTVVSIVENIIQKIHASIADGDLVKIVGDIITSLRILDYDTFDYQKNLDNLNGRATENTPRSVELHMTKCDSYSIVQTINVGKLFINHCEQEAISIWITMINKHSSGVGSWFALSERDNEIVVHKSPTVLSNTPAESLDMEYTIYTLNQ